MSDGLKPMQAFGMLVSAIKCGEPFTDAHEKAADVLRAALSDTGDDFTPLRLPKIDAETLDLLGDTDLIEDGGWTQVAVDFGCLLNEHRWSIKPLSDTGEDAKLAARLQEVNNG